MECPLCGDECRCSYVPSARAAEGATSFASPDPSAPILVDPEEYDYSEQQFTASLAAEEEEPAMASANDGADAWTLVSASAAQRVARARAARTAQIPDINTDQWRQEVSSRVEKYRVKRGRPRPEPSLRFDFDAYEQSPASPVQVSAAVAEVETAEPAVEEAPAPAPSQFQPSEQARAELPLRSLGMEGPYARAEGEPAVSFQVAEPDINRCVENIPEEPEQEPEWAKIIEFPRQPVTPPSYEELAEPIADVPRILEAPEEVKAETPLADITLSQEVDEAIAALFDLPLQPAPMEQRVFAGLVDAMLVLMSTGVFLLIASRMSAHAPDGKAGMALLFALPCVLWAAYQYVFLVYAGETPGMEMAHIGLSTFEGTPVGRGLRRGRAFAMMLAAFSLGLGLLWALLDEDTLCWHDRITKTYPVRTY